MKTHKFLSSFKFIFTKSYHLSLLKSILSCRRRKWRGTGGTCPLNVFFCCVPYSHYTIAVVDSVLQQKPSHACGVVNTIYELLSFWFA